MTTLIDLGLALLNASIVRRYSMMSSSGLPPSGWMYTTSCPLMSSSILRYCSPSGNLCLLTLPSFAPVRRETLTARVSPAEPPKIIIFTRARLMGARSRLCALCVLVELLHQGEDGSGRHYALLGDIEVDVLRGSDVKDRVAELYLRIVRAPFLRGD